MLTVGERLRIARDRKGVKQTKVSKDTGINNKTLSGYERNISEPDLDTIKILADYYNISLDFLLGKTNEITPYKENSSKEKYPDVHDVEEAMKIILQQPGLMLKGELLSDESKIILANAIQMGLRTAEELEKKKNTKGDVND